MTKKKTTGKLTLSKSTVAALTVRTGITAGWITGSSICGHCINHNQRRN